MTHKKPARIANVMWNFFSMTLLLYSLPWLLKTKWTLCCLRIIFIYCVYFVCLVIENFNCAQNNNHNKRSVKFGFSTFTSYLWFKWPQRMFVQSNGIIQTLYFKFCSTHLLLQKSRLEFPLILISVYDSWLQFQWMTKFCKYVNTKLRKQK